MPQFSCSSNLCLQQGSRSALTFCTRFLQKLLRKPGSRSAPGQLVRPPFSHFQWYKAFQPPVSQLSFWRSYASGLHSLRLPVLFSAGRLMGLRISGNMMLRAFIYTYLHHGTEPRLHSLSCPNHFDGFGYPQIFAGGLIQIQFLADTHFTQLLRSRYCHLLLTRSCIVLKPLHC